MQRPSNLFHSLFQYSIGSQPRVVTSDEFNFLREFPIEYRRCKDVQELCGEEVDWQTIRDRYAETAKMISGMSEDVHQLISPLYERLCSAVKRNVNGRVIQLEIFNLIDSLAMSIPSEVTHSTLLMMLEDINEFEGQTILAWLAMHNMQTVLDYIYVKLIAPRMSVNYLLLLEWAIKCNQPDAVIFDKINWPIMHEDLHRFMQWAAVTGRVELMKRLLRCDPDYFAVRVCNYLYLTCLSGQPKAIQFMLSIPNSYTNYADHIGIAMGQACGHFRLEVVETLLPKYKELVVGTEAQKISLICLLDGRHVTAAQYLIDNEVLPNELEKTVRYAAQYQKYQKYLNCKILIAFILKNILLIENCSLTDEATLYGWLKDKMNENKQAFIPFVRNILLHFINLNRPGEKLLGAINFLKRLEHPSLEADALPLHCKIYYALNDLCERSLVNQITPAP